MEKKIKFRTLCFTFIIAITMIACGTDSDDNYANLTPNFPYSVRYSLSYKITRKVVNIKFEEPQLTLKNDNYEYDIWNKEDVKMVAIYSDGSLVHLFKYDDILELRAFETIQVNVSTMEDVKKIDQFLYLFNVDDSNKATSEHALDGNSMLTITYEKRNDNWVVIHLENKECEILDFELIQGI